MRVLKGILKESKAYYKNIEKEIKKRLKFLPKGSIKRRRIKNNIYYYLQSREDGKVIHQYLGKEKPSGLEKTIDERKKLKIELKEVKKSLKFLKRIKND
jgi:hypothetical protein